MECHTSQREQGDLAIAAKGLPPTKQALTIPNNEWVLLLWVSFAQVYSMQAEEALGLQVYFSLSSLPPPPPLSVMQHWCGRASKNASLSEPVITDAWVFNMVLMRCAGVWHTALIHLKLNKAPVIATTQAIHFSLGHHPFPPVDGSRTSTIFFPQNEKPIWNARFK